MMHKFRHLYHHLSPCGYGYRIMSVEDEVKMLEEAKEYLEVQLGNINQRLEKLKD